ncbi:hypothetical protein DFH09DRAFT_479120 [Mycena vulgaris]|nr:hypothetical protein DFH09DRAFT_479120 [Mycena vulgaris]
MDIVGVVAGALQFIDIMVKARDYLHDFRDAPEDQQRILRELISIKPLLEQLDKRIKSSGVTSIGAKQLEERMLDLNGLIKQLTTILKPVLSSGWKTLKRIEWTLWGKNDVKEALSTIERFKTMCIWESVNDLAEEQRTDNQSMINSVQHGFKEQREILEDTREGERLEHQYISKSVRDVARNQERYHDYHDSAERDKIIEWFSPLNFFLRQADIFSTRQPGTGEWLLQDEFFNRWRLGAGRTLWCRGMPGAGKTVLASIAVDDLRATLENVGVAVIYLNHKETEVQSLSNLLAGIWRQLVFKKAISSSVHRLHEEHREPRTRPSREETRDVLCSAVVEYSKVFIIVDALDEYPEQQRGSLLHSLSSLGSTVNLMVTSRPHIAVNYLFRTLETLEIRAAEDDIRKHLNAEILRSSRLLRHIENQPNLREEIVITIVRRSDGMFLLAKLHIDSLTTKHTVKAVRAALTNMPTDLDSTYDEVVDRINRQSEDDKMLAWRTLSWVTNAKRPLRPSELRQALAVEPGTRELDPDNRLDMDTILSVCAGLVVINEADKRVRLIHYTMQTYLDSVHARDFPRAQTDITMTCITYLSFDIFSQALDDALTLNLFRRNSLLDYAVEYCLVHARGRPEWDIRDSILSFLSNSSGWWKLWNWKRSYDKRRKSGATLWVAAAFQLDNVCWHLIRGGVDGGAALHEAAFSGLSDIVQVLIDTGVHPDAARNDSKQCASALQAASTRGHTDTIRLLLDRSASIEFRGLDHLGTTPLQIAAFFGRKPAVSLLISRGADVNARAGRHGTALHTASSRNHFDIVRILLAHGARAQDEDELGSIFSTLLTTQRKEICTSFERGASQGGYEDLIDGPIDLDRCLLVETFPHLQLDTQRPPSFSHSTPLFMIDTEAQHQKESRVIQSTLYLGQAW